HVSPVVPFLASRTLACDPKPLSTKAREAKAASSASVRATSTIAGMRGAPASSRAAMPPEPKSCTAIIRSALAGPRRTRTKPGEDIANTNPLAANKKSPMVTRRSRRADQQCLLLRELRDDRLTNIKAVNEKPVALAGPRGKCAGKKTRKRAERVAGNTGRHVHWIIHEAWAQRQSGIERSPCDIRA